MSAMPGPSSRAITSTAGTPPRLASDVTACISTSPRPAWVTMLRATSEMAVAINVASVAEQPIWLASSRPDWRATTMSPSVEMTILMRPSGMAHPPSRWSRKARPSSRSRAVCTSSNPSPSCTSEKATSGCMPTTTVSAPRSSVMWAIVRNDRAANESITSSDVMSTMMPRDRYTPIWRIRSSRSRIASLSVMADWMVAMRYSPCLRMGTAIGRSAQLHRRRRLRLRARHLVAEQLLRHLDATLEVADRVHLRQIDADRHERQGDLGREAGDDHARAHQAGGVDRLHEVVGHGRVDLGHAGDVDDDDLGAVGADGAEELLGELPGALAVEGTDDRQDHEPLAHLQHGRRQLADGLLLLADDALALLDEADPDRVGDAVGRRLVGVEHPVEQVEVGLVLLEQRPGEHVAQQQDDADHLVGLDAPGDDALGEATGVVLQRLDLAGLEHLDVVVVDARRLAEHLVGCHGGEHGRPRDAPRPLLPRRGPGL